jgi:hypothetical protein
LIDAHKARTKEWCRLYNKLDVTQFQAEETHEKPLTGRAKCVMRPGQGQESQSLGGYQAGTSNIQANLGGWRGRARPNTAIPFSSCKR